MISIDLISRTFLVHAAIRKAVNVGFARAGQPWTMEHLVFLAAVPAGKGIPLRNVTAAVFGSDQPPMRRTLSSLEKAGLIQLKRETEDRRHLRVHITSEGLAMLGVLSRLAQGALDKALCGLGQDTLARLGQTLDDLDGDLELSNSEVA